MNGGGLLIVLAIVVQAPGLNAQGSQGTTGPGIADIEKALMSSGFENVVVARIEDRLVVAYENRMYRYEVSGLADVVSAVAPYAAGARSLILIQQRHGLPLRSITMQFSEVQDGKGGVVPSEWRVVHSTVDVDQRGNFISDRVKASSSFRRFDLTFRPHFAALFGNYADAVQTQIGLIPEVRATLARGLRLRAQVILPIQSEFGEEGDYVRPGIVSINQTLRLPRNTFVSLSGGYFSDNRYGVDLESRTYFGNRFAVGARLGCTGFAGIRGGSWTQSSLGRITGAITADYYVEKVALMVRSSLERFVYGDFGWRVDVVRAFGEFRLGFFGLISEGANNAGFNVSVPLFGRKYRRPGRLRVRPARAFDWQYRYRGFPSSGIRYETGHEIDGLWDGVFPGFFQTLWEDHLDTLGETAGRHPGLSHRDGKSPRASARGQPTPKKFPSGLQPTR